MLPRNRDWEAHGKHASANKRAGNTPAQTPALLGLTFKPDRARHGDHKHRVGRGGSTAVLKPPRAQALQARLAPCLVCHGDTGRSENPEVPSLGGQPSVFPDPALRLSRATTPSPRNSRSYLRPSPPGRPTRRAGKGPHPIGAAPRGFCHNRDLSGHTKSRASPCSGGLPRALREYRARSGGAAMTHQWT
jgi:cytochrome c553